MFEDHKTMVDALAKDGLSVKADLTPQTAHLLHMAVGISGEAGELLDAIKKCAIYNKPLDLTNVIEELGDLQFYIQGLMTSLDLNHEQVLKANMDKLSKRYSTGRYSDNQAKNRADK